MNRKKLLAGLVAVSAMTAMSLSTAGAATKTTKKKASTKTTKKAAAKARQKSGAGVSKLLWDNGPCDTKLPKYKIGMETVFTSPVLSLKDQVDAMDASVTAFNKRGGIGGHCMEFTPCDNKADPNQSVACARKFVDDGVHVTLNDQGSFNPQGYYDILAAAKLPTFAAVPSTPNSAAAAKGLSWSTGGGGTGTTFSMIPRCIKKGFTKIGIIHVDTPTFGQLLQTVVPMMKAYNAEIVATSPVAAGTTDYQQFTLAMQKAGAQCIALPLGETEAKQVLRAAQQLGAKELFSASTGTFGLADTQAFGDFASQLLLNSEVPPVTATEQFPILKDMVADLEASGKPELKAPQIKASPQRSWLAVYTLVRTIEDFGTPSTVSREAIIAAASKAQGINTGGLIPTWNPNVPALPSTSPFFAPFGNLSNPWFHQIDFDAKTKNFVVLAEKINYLNEITGQIKYDQPK